MNEPEKTDNSCPLKLTNNKVLNFFIIAGRAIWIFWEIFQQGCNYLHRFSGWSLKTYNEQRTNRTNRQVEISKKVFEAYQKIEQGRGDAGRQELEELKIRYGEKAVLKELQKIQAWKCLNRQKKNHGK